VVRAVAAAAAAAAILLALPSTFWTCVGDNLAANAFSVCNMSIGFRDAGQSGLMSSTSRVYELRVPTPVLQIHGGWMGERTDTTLAIGERRNHGTLYTS
jgi:hypothetical protein